ncbi:MAG TPA: chorismate synthase [Candidatus Limnocylindrales bacterium]
MRRLRLLTAGESHGPAVSGVLEGLPYGLRISTANVNRDLRRRQHGYGSGRRMLIEQDRVVWMGGIRFGQTLGSPLAFRIENRDFENWKDRMTAEALPARGRPKAVTLARPGHADLAGAVKYGADDVRDVLERASARSTAVRVLAGAVCRQLLATVGVQIWSFVEQIGPIRAYPDAQDALECVPAGWPAADLRSPGPLRCPDPAAEALMIQEIDRAAGEGDSIGGAFVVVATGLPMGLGSAAEWDTRLDGALAGALMAIPAVKAVGIGAGFDVAARRGSNTHDAVLSEGVGWERGTNRAGGIEGGMSNGMPIVVHAAVKPVPTMRKPLDSVDIVTGESGRAHIERSDVAIMPRAAIVGEAMTALVLADALLTSFGGDTIGDLRAAVARRRRREKRPH